MCSNVSPNFPRRILAFLIECDNEMINCPRTAIQVQRMSYPYSDPS